MTLKDLAAKLEAMAEAAWSRIVDTASIVIEKIEPVAEDAFVKLLNAFGDFAVQKVIDLMGTAGDGLTGTAKHDLVAREIVDQAAQQGVVVSAADASALTKMAFVSAAAKAPPPRAAAA